MPRVTISIKDKQAQPYRFPLDREKVTLGRGSDNDITIQSGSVSVHHAKMIRVPGGYELCDLESTNGLKLDGERVETVRLKHGMTVRVGDAEFFFQLSDEEIAELKGEVPGGAHDKEEKDEKKEKKEEEKKEDNEDKGDKGEKKENKENQKEGKRRKKDDDDDEDDDDEEERPRKKARKKSYDDDSSDWDGDSRRSRPSSREVKSSSGGGGALFLVFLVLAVIAFCVGVAIRFQKETGKSLIDTIRARVQPAEAPASGQESAQEPADEPPAAE